MSQTVCHTTYISGRFRKAELLSEKTEHSIRVLRKVETFINLPAYIFHTEQQHKDNDAYKRIIVEIHSWWRLSIEMQPRSSVTLVSI
jgi:hypothetical protein